MALRDRTWYPVLYMFVITLFLSAVIILFGSITRQRVKDNERIAYERAVLQALPIDLPANAGPSQIHGMYTANILDPDKTSAGALRYVKGGSLVAYALPIEGPGFWAPIRGIIGIKADKRTVSGIAFYEQNETPGLGGEIVKPEFRSQFVGKKLAASGAPIRILPPTATLDESAVHAITGATQTSTRLGKFMNELLSAWRTEVDKN
jgi:Na+-transporting NADH:ubiquinone oxidoreductase subunit C